MIAGPVCPTCGLPQVWSVDQARLWCAGYGTHPAVPVHLAAERPRLPINGGLVLVQLVDGPLGTRPSVVRHRQLERDSYRRRRARLQAVSA